MAGGLWDGLEKGFPDGKSEDGLVWPLVIQHLQERFRATGNAEERPSLGDGPSIVRLSPRLSSRDGGGVNIEYTLFCTFFFSLRCSG